MFNSGDRDPNIRLLEEQYRTARNEYVAACRELIRRDRQGTATPGDPGLSRAAIDCAAKKRAYASSTDKLRSARHGR